MEALYCFKIEAVQSKIKGNAELKIHFVINFEESEE